MRKNALYVVIFIIILVVAVILSVNGLKNSFGGGDAEPTPSAQVNETQTPAAQTAEPESENTPEPTPEATEPPVFVTKEPIETPEVTPEATPQPVVDASGSFNSSTGTYLDIVVEWTAATGSDGNAELTVNVSSRSYSFFTSALYNAITITVNGKSVSMNSPEVDYDGSELKETPLASHTFSVPMGTSSIDVTWDYKGSYGGTELEKISASGSAFIG